MASKLSITIKYATIVAISFAAGYLLSMKHEQDKLLYLVNGWLSIGMIDDVGALNALQNGNVDAAIDQLEANVYGGLLGWDSTGLIQQLLEREPKESPYIKDLSKALQSASEYSSSYHDPEIARAYDDIFSKYRTHN